MLTFIVAGQKLSRIDNIGVANLSQKYLKCRFLFDSEWDGITTKTAIFYDSTGKESYKKILDNDNTCIADSRALKNGSFTVTVYGTKEDDSEFVLTTNKVLVKMNASGFTADSDNTEESNPELIEQVVIKYLNDHAGGAVTPEELQEAVNNYLDENPISGAGEMNVQSDWNQTDSTKDDYIKNKPTVLNGKDGKGIVSIQKTSSAGLVDVYTITYTDDTTSTFTVTNGKDGSGTGIGGTGADREDGVGIADISKTNTVGLVDTYTITYTDGTTSTFEVTNGAPGQDGANGKSLEFNWDGTKLGVRQEGDLEYVYVDLKGADGVGGSADIFENKNVIFIGDSFMCGHGARVAEGLDSSVSVITTPQATSAENVMRGYAKAFKDKHSTANVYNLAVYGATIAFQQDSPCMYNQFDYLENTLAITPDYIVMNGGANDIFQGITIGEIAEGYNLFDGTNYDSTQTIPCLEATFSMLLNNNPEAKVIFINPPAMDSTAIGDSEAAIQGINELIREVCNKWGIIYLDMNGLTNKGSANEIISNNTTYYGTDKVHPLQAFYTDTIDIISGIMKNPINTKKDNNDSEIDLSNYYTKSEVDTLTSNLVGVSGSKWANKTLCAFGTSLTARCGTASGYLQVLKESLGLTSFTNNGSDGHAIAYISGRAGISRKIQETDITSFDLITIEGCTNDFKLNVPLGSVGQMGDTDLDDTAGFCQALRKAIEYILTSNPEANILLIADPQRDNSDYDVNYTNSAGYKLIDYVDAMIQIGALYGIPVCDLYRNSGINALTLSTYTSDGLHLNTLGNTRVGNVISAVLNNMYSNTVIVYNNSSDTGTDNGTGEGGDSGNNGDTVIETNMAVISNTTFDLSVANGYTYKMIMLISNAYYMYYSNSPFYIYDSTEYKEVYQNDIYRAKATIANPIFSEASSLATYGTAITDGNGYRYQSATERTLSQYVWSNADIKYWGTDDVAVSASV